MIARLQNGVTANDVKRRYQRALDLLTMILGPASSLIGCELESSPLIGPPPPPIGLRASDKSMEDSRTMFPLRLSRGLSDSGPLLTTPPFSLKPISWNKSYFCSRNLSLITISMFSISVNHWLPGRSGSSRWMEPFHGLAMHEFTNDNAYLVCSTLPRFR